MIMGSWALERALKASDFYSESKEGPLGLRSRGVTSLYLQTRTGSL